MPDLPLPKSNVEWHAAVTHFPITLLFVAVFFDVVALFFKRPALREFSLWMLTLCVISLPFSLLSGWLTGREYKRAPVGYDQHWQAAVITSVLALVLLVWRLAAKDKLPRMARVTILTLTGACAMGVGYTGHQGGEMVFGGREDESAVAAAPTPDASAGAEKIALSADKMQVAAEKLGVSTDRLALAAQSKIAPPPPTVIEKQPINVVPADAMTAAAKKLDGVATRFDQTATKLEQIAESLKNTKNQAPAPTSTAPTGVKPGGKTPVPVATQPAKSDLDPKLVAAGEKLYFSEDLGCDSCHKMDGKGGKKGPDLTHAGTLHSDVEWQIGHLKDPPKYVPGSKMPDYADQKPDDLRAIATFLVSKK